MSIIKYIYYNYKKIKYKKEYILLITLIMK